MKRKTFKDNDSYFKFYNEVKDEIEVIEVRVKNKITLVYKTKGE